MGSSRNENNVASSNGVAEDGADQWTFEEEKILERGLVEHWSASNRLEIVASLLPTKPLHVIQAKFGQLESEVRDIEEGRVLLPSYGPEPSMSKKKSNNATAEQERRKGIPWTEEEHRLFLLGLAKFGKGDWRSISRNYVVSRTPTQVASHAQKYFIRLNSMSKKDKRRSSIHDITTVTPAAGEITGMMPGGLPLLAAQGPVPGPLAMFAPGLPMGPLPAMLMPPRPAPQPPRPGQ